MPAVLSSSVPSARDELRWPSNSGGLGEGGGGGGGFGGGGDGGGGGGHGGSGGNDGGGGGEEGAGEGGGNDGGSKGGNGLDGGAIGGADGSGGMEGGKCGEMHASKHDTLKQSAWRLASFSGLQPVDKAIRRASCKCTWSAAGGIGPRRPPAWLLRIAGAK